MRLASASHSAAGPPVSGEPPQPDHNLKEMYLSVIIVASCLEA